IPPRPVVGALGVITRGSVITIARDLGYDVVERDLVRTDLYLADEVFFTGTAAELTPIREVDDRTVGIGNRGPVTKELQEAFFAATKGEDQRYIDWLNFVDDCTHDDARIAVPAPADRHPVAVLDRPGPGSRCGHVRRHRGLRDH